MLLVNGELMRVEDVIKMYNVPVPSKTARRKERIFEMSDRLKKRDYLNGGHRHPNQIMCPTEFTGIHDGIDVTIRYYQRTRIRKTNGVSETEYMPARIGMNADKKLMDTKGSLEEYVFMYLHPYNEDSPLRSRNSKSRWKLRDEVKEAQESNKRTQDLMFCLDQIYNVDIVRVRQKAKGLKVGNVDKLEDAELRLKLEELANKNPGQFREIWEDTATMYRALCQAAIDRRIIMKKPISGQDYWFWNEDAGGEKLCIIPATSHDDFEVLLQFAADNFSTVMKRIQKHVEGGNVDEKIRRGDQTKDARGQAEEVVIDAIDYGVIINDGGSVYLTKSNGAKDKLIVKLESPKGWMRATVDALHDGPAKEMMKTVTERLGRAKS
jgi:hypothetical protein